MRNLSPIPACGPLASCLHTHHDHGLHLPCRKMFCSISRSRNGMVVVNRASRIAKEASIDAPSTNPMTAAVLPTIHPTNTSHFQHFNTHLIAFARYSLARLWATTTPSNPTLVPKNPSDQNLIIQYLYYLRGAIATTSLAPRLRLQILLRALSHDLTMERVRGCL